MGNSESVDIPGTDENDGECEDSKFVDSRKEEDEKDELSYKNGKLKLKAKLAFVGDKGVGKTSILYRIVRNEFADWQPSTIGACNWSHSNFMEYMDNEFEVILDIWDVSGDERYKNLSRMHYVGCDVCAIVYDVNSYESFKNAKCWMKEVTDEGLSKKFIYLIGTKSDLDVVVDISEAEAYCYDVGINFFGEVSAKTGKCLELCYRKMISSLTKNKLDKLGIETMLLDEIKSEIVEKHDELEEGENKKKGSEVDEIFEARLDDKITEKRRRKSSSKKKNASDQLLEVRINEKIRRSSKNKNKPKNNGVGEIDEIINEKKRRRSSNKKKKPKEKKKRRKSNLFHIL